MFTLLAILARSEPEGRERLNRLFCLQSWSLRQSRGSKQLPRVGLSLAGGCERIPVGYEVERFRQGLATFGCYNALPPSHPE